MTIPSLIVVVGVVSWIAMALFISCALVRRLVR
jgi:hypothetical protein